jgi:hypothetical protein
MSLLEYPPSNKEWARNKGLVRSCSRHNRDYDAWMGCPECEREKREKDLERLDSRFERSAGHDVALIDDGVGNLICVMNTSGQPCHAEESTFTSSAHNTGHGSGDGELMLCPKCKHRSLFWNSHLEVYECMDRHCRETFRADVCSRRK